MDRAAGDRALRILMQKQITGYMLSQSISVAATLGVADLLVGGPQEIHVLAEKLKVDPGALYRLLRALSSEGIFRETESKTFELTPSADLLRSDVPGSLRTVAILYGSEFFRTWGDLLTSVRHGRAVFPELFGSGLFHYLSAHSESHQIFDKAMSELSHQHARAVVPAFDFSRFKTLLDVGGGDGTFLVHLLEQYPDLRAAVFDLPEVISRAQESLAASPYFSRCQLLSGSFFQALPRGYDAYFLKYILHDWNDSDAVSILKNVRSAMGEGSKLLIVEMIIPEGNDPFYGKFIDLHMLVMFGSKERTRIEFESILAEAGFVLSAVTPTAAMVSVIEADPI